MNIILLTCPNELGRNGAAPALQQALRTRNVACELVDAGALLGENVAEPIRNAFFNIALKTPRAFSFLYQTEDFTATERRKTPVYFANALFAENLCRYMAETAADAAVCFQLYTAEALTYLKRKLEMPIKSYFVPTDYACVPFLEETDMDAVFAPHADMVMQLARRGVPKERIVPSGVPVQKKYRYTTARSSARATLDIPPDVTAYLMMAGEEGCSDAATVTRKIIERSKGETDIRVIVMTGRNALLGEQLRRSYEGDPRVMTVPFTEQISLYMDASDVLIARPKGTLSTEAAVKGIPLVHTLPANATEALNAQFFAERGMAISTVTPDSAADNAVRLGHDVLQKNRMREAQRQYMNNNTMERILNVILPDWAAADAETSGVPTDGKEEEA